MQVRGGSSWGHTRSPQQTGLCQCLSPADTGTPKMKASSLPALEFSLPQRGEQKASLLLKVSSGATGAWQYEGCAAQGACLSLSQPCPHSPCVLGFLCPLLSALTPVAFPSASPPHVPQHPDATVMKNEKTAKLGVKDTPGTRDHLLLGGSRTSMSWPVG